MQKKIHTHNSWNAEYPISTLFIRDETKENNFIVPCKKYLEKNLKLKWSREWDAYILE